MEVVPDKAGALCANSHPGSYTEQDAFNNMFPVVCNYSGGGISATIDASYYKGAGSRNGKEREFVAILKKVCAETAYANRVPAAPGLPEVVG